MEISGKIALVIIILFVVLSGIAVWFLFAKQKTPEPVSNPVSLPPPALSFPLMRVVSGNILSITPEKREITVGTYRVENNKAVLASQKTVKFTAETVFVRQAPTAKNPFAEATIASTNIKKGDIIEIIPVGAGDNEPLVAKKVTLLSLPPPPLAR